MGLKTDLPPKVKKAVEALFERLEPGHCSCHPDAASVYEPALRWFRDSMVEHYNIEIPSLDQDDWDDEEED